MTKDMRSVRKGSAAGASGTGYYESYDRQKLDPRDKEGFKSAMLSFCRANKVAAEALLAGNVQMLGLDQLKEDVGQERWEKIKGRVHLLTETIIKKLITPNDLYVQVNDEQFIVLYGQGTREQAHVKSKRIAEEVNTRLNGAGAGAETITVKAMVLELPRDEVDELTTVDGLSKAVVEAEEAKVQADREMVDEVKEELKVTFLPIANVRKRLISMYQTHIDTSDESFLEEPSDTGAVESELDMLALEKSKEALIGAVQMNWRALMIVPVHLETLDVRRYRELYLAQCRVLPQIASQRMLLYVVDMPDDIPQSKLHSIFTYFAPFFAGFIGRFSRDFKRSEKLGGINLMGVATDGSDIGEVTPGVAEEMRNFVTANREGRTRTFFTGAPSFAVGTAARRAKFDYVQGPGIARGMSIFGKALLIPEA